jgi:hypothetical protein
LSPSARIIGSYFARSERIKLARSAGLLPMGSDATVVGRRLAGHADDQQHLSVPPALADRVIAVVGAVERLVGRDVQAVRLGEDPFAPRPQEIAFAVEDHHRMPAATEHVHVVVAVDGDRRDVREFPPLRQAAPAFLHPVDEFARPDDDRRRRRLLSVRTGTAIAPVRHRHVSSSD